MQIRFVVLKDKLMIFNIIFEEIVLLSFDKNLALNISIILEQYSIPLYHLEIVFL